MNSLPVNQFSTFPLSFFKDSVDTYLTPQNKKIILIASLVFACLAALYVLSRCCGSGKELETFDDVKYEYADGTEFVGKLKDRKWIGKKTDFDGKIEEGEFYGFEFFSTSKLGGNGKITFPDGMIWEGTFFNGKLSGKGKKTHPNGTTEEGDFFDDLLNGRGKVTYPKGDIMDGFFKNGKLDGYGKIIHPDGTIEEGLFENGNLVKRKPKPTYSAKAAENAPSSSTTTPPLLNAT